MTDRSTFSVSDAARERIRANLKTYADKTGNAAIPAICWISAELNNHKIDSQVAIGFYDDRSDIESDIIVVNGIEIVLAVADDDLFRFLGKTLDFENGYYVLK